MFMPIKQPDGSFMWANPAHEYERAFEKVVLNKGTERL